MNYKTLDVCVVCTKGNYQLLVLLPTLEYCEAQFIHSKVFVYANMFRLFSSMFSATTLNHAGSVRWYYGTAESTQKQVLHTIQRTKTASRAISSEIPLWKVKCDEGENIGSSSTAKNERSSRWRWRMKLDHFIRSRVVYSWGMCVSNQHVHTLSSVRLLSIIDSSIKCHRWLLIDPWIRMSVENEKNERRKLTVCGWTQEARERMRFNELVGCPTTHTVPSDRVREWWFEIRTL